MKRSTRHALAAALAASVAFGIAAPASAAAYSAHGVHAKAGGHGPKQDGRDDKSGDKVSKKVAAEKRKVAREIARKDDALARLAKDARRLDSDFEQAVLANVAGDRSLLVGFDSALESSATLAEVRAVDAQVESLRPELYKQVVGNLRRAERIADRGGDQVVLIEELSALAGEAQAAGGDVLAVLDLLAEARAHNEQAGAAFDSAIAKVLGLTAVSGKRAEKDAEVALKSVEALLRQADAQIEAAQEALDDVATNETEPTVPAEPVEPTEPGVV
jgi:hypothetical protein